MNNVNLLFHTFDPYDTMMYYCICVCIHTLSNNNVIIIIIMI